MSTQKEIFYQFLINQRGFLENEIIQLRQNLRMRKIDAVDCLELALAMERFNAFSDFASIATTILKMDMPADYAVKCAKIDYADLYKAASEAKKNKKG